MTNQRITQRTRQAAVLLAGAVIGSVAMAISGPTANRASTEIGDARVALGSQTARAVERVAYSEGVQRIGDVVIDGGETVGEITDPDIAMAWEIVSGVWPESLRFELRQLSVISEHPGGLVGVTHRSSTGGWIVSIDRTDLNDRRLVQETVIHEIAHIVTLAPIDFGFDTDTACEGVRISAGCAAEGTLMARYADRFWPGGAADTSAWLLVNDYAATAPHEDLAETFTAWVAGWPVGSAAVEDRMAFLSADPRMAGLAAEIREQLDAS